MKLKYATVPRLCPGGTVLCIGGGPSLTREDLALAQGHLDATVAVNNAYQLAPWATVLYAADARWWGWHKGVPSFTGLKYTLVPDNRLKDWGVQLLENTGFDGLEATPTGLKTGRNSGYQAINLAVHLGASRILLLGYDMAPGPRGEEHWHKDHPNHSRSPYKLFRSKFDTLIDPLKAAGVTVINCSRRTALTAFPRQALEHALRREVAA